MQAAVTPQAETAITEIAQRHGISREAVRAMLYAVHAGGGTMAQFAIPELGGSGQWMRGGMTMVGDMFDNALKARVDALCTELAQLLASTAVFAPTTTPGAVHPQNSGHQAGFASGFSSGNWWPADLGVPSSSGGQNNARYAIFPGTRRLAIQINGHTRIFDTGEHQITGVQQQQGSGSGGTVGFTSQFGTFDVSSLTELGRQPAVETPAAAPVPPPRVQPPQPHPAPPGSSGDPGTIVAAIEQLAGLHERGILSDEEFATKKAELLSRL